MKIIGKNSFELQDPTNLRPHGDRLIVEIVDLENAVYTETNIKIVIPETSDMQVERGWQLARVVAIGNGHRLEINDRVPMPFAAGDLVLIERLTGRKLRLQHRDYLVISQVDVLCHVPPLPVELPELALA